MSKVLTELQAIELQEWIERAKPKLGLSDWVIEVKRSKSDKGSIACIVTNVESRHGRVWVSKTFLHESEWRRTQIMVHELLHVWTQRLLLCVVDATGDNLPPVVEREEERTVDAIARAISFAFDPVVLSAGGGAVDLDEAGQASVTTDLVARLEPFGDVLDSGSLIDLPTRSGFPAHPDPRSLPATDFWD